MEPTYETHISCACRTASCGAFHFRSDKQPRACRHAPMKSGDMQFYSRQATDMRASNLMGANVTNMANETVGEINDLVLDKDGKVVAVVVGVGGFLGIGERQVALDYKSLNIKYDPNAMTNAGATTIQVNATKDSLKNAPAWTWNTDKNTGTSPSDDGDHTKRKTKKHRASVTHDDRGGMPVERQESQHCRPEPNGSNEIVNCGKCPGPKRYG